MSRSAAATARPAARPAPRTASRPGTSARSTSRRTEPARPTLKVVAPNPWRAPRAPFVMLSLTVVSLGLLALLGLNTVVAQNAFTLDRLERRSAALAADEQRLEREVAAREAPDQVAGRARALGLVPPTDPAFLRLSDGVVLGEARPATAPPRPAPKPNPATANAAPKPAAAKPAAAGPATAAATTTKAAGTPAQPASSPSAAPR